MLVLHSCGLPALPTPWPSMTGLYVLRVGIYADMTESADVTDFDYLSDWVGNSQLDGVKFGETPTRTIPSEA